MIEHSAYTLLPSGATVYPDLDFETYSEAGYYFDGARWRSITKSPPHGLGAVGASVYTEHPSAEVLSLAYNLKDGLGPRLWIPGMPPPDDLFHHIAGGHLLEAFNSSFEFYTWHNICVARMGWPPLPYEQLRCAMSKARAFSLPGALGKVAEVTGVQDQKIKDGTRLLNKFSKPRSPTKHDPRLRIRPEDDPIDAQELYNYNLGDIKSESAVSAVIPDLSQDELELWLLDQKINLRGVHVDLEALDNCTYIVEQAFLRYESELPELTGGVVNSAGEVQKITEWVQAQGVNIANLTADVVKATLDNWDRGPKQDKARRVLEIRSILGAASVKKLFAIIRRISKDGRLRDLFAYYGSHTGRFAGRGPQPQNLPASGPEVRLCTGCNKHYDYDTVTTCPWCGCLEAFSTEAEWGAEAVNDALEVIARRDLALVELYFGDAIAAVSGCLRGLFSAAPGHDLICSDYSAIEAVVLAALAGEEWRLEVFRTHGKIYEMSAAKITGIPFEEFLRHKEETGNHHPMRKKIGKVGELGSGYGGWIGAWKAFGADQYFNSDREIKDAILSWREESPAIVEFWGGQVRKHPDRWEWKPELYGLEGTVVMAISNPGLAYSYRDISYQVQDDVLYCKLPSGRKLCYHNPRLIPTICLRSGLHTYAIHYMGWNSDYIKGPVGWMELETYGGKLAENITQAAARDILTYAMKNIERAGYPIVLHVHDEIASEVPLGSGSIEEFELIMGILPPWAIDWPIHASGGWRGQRYRKD